MKKNVLLIIFFVLLSYNAFAKDYVIGDGDTLQISVWGNPELSLETTVRPDGKISLPALGEIKASGLTPLELTDVLEKEMAKMVKRPIVTIIVTQMTNYRIFVIGRGVATGVHTLLRETTLIEFLARLGPLENADFENSYLVRNKEKIRTDFTSLIEEGDFNQDVVLEADDILFIPDNFGRRVSIVGAVNKPTTVPYRKGLTVIDVILSAGGFTQFAKENDVKIIRNKQNKRTELTVRAKDLTKNGNMKENILIMPSDFVIVKERMF